MVRWNCMDLLGELLIYCLFLFVRRFSQNCEKRLLGSLCLSVCLYVRLKKLVSHWADFHEIRHVNIFQKALSKKKFKISLKCVNNSGYCTWRPICIYRGADKSLARQGRKQARKHVRDARDFNRIETRAVIKFLFVQDKAPKEIHAILRETLACFLPGLAKDLSALLYNYTSLNCC